MVENQVKSIMAHVRGGGNVRAGREIDYLGYVFNGEYTLVRKRNKQSFARKLANAKTNKRKIEVYAFGKGVLKHCKGVNLWNKITNHHTIMSLSDYGISTHPTETKDGKKLFDAETVTCLQLVGQEFTITGVELDVVTKHGGGRVVVEVQTSDGKKKKFISNSISIKNACSQIVNAEQNGVRVLGQVKTTLKSVKLANGWSYEFT